MKLALDIHQLHQKSRGDLALKAHLLEEPLLGTPHAGPIIVKPIETLARDLFVDAGERVLPVALLMLPDLANFVQLEIADELDRGIRPICADLLLDLQKFFEKLFS